MNEVKLCCDVRNCCHNQDGCTCAKDGIHITTGTQTNSAHYCADYCPNKEK